ncbi:hypothetical protein J6590_013816 [Homalodisca vitripennis]|nr:hypothetical protein J6590_013816 [Homalodisca vitripennis]
MFFKESITEFSKARTYLRQGPIRGINMLKTETCQRMAGLVGNTPKGSGCQKAIPLELSEAEACQRLLQKSGICQRTAGLVGDHLEGGRLQKSGICQRTAGLVGDLPEGGSCQTSIPPRYWNLLKAGVARGRGFLEVDNSTTRNFHIGKLPEETFQRWGTARGWEMLKDYC